MICKVKNFLKSHSWLTGLLPVAFPLHIWPRQRDQMLSRADDPASSQRCAFHSVGPGYWGNFPTIFLLYHFRLFKVCGPRRVDGNHKRALKNTLWSTPPGGIWTHEGIPLLKCGGKAHSLQCCLHMTLAPCCHLECFEPDLYDKAGAIFMVQDWN